MTYPIILFMQRQSRAGGSSRLLHAANYCVAADLLAALEDWIADLIRRVVAARATPEVGEAHVGCYGAVIASV